MISLASQSIVFLIGLLVSVLSVWGCFVPDQLTRLVMRVVDQDWGIYFAVVVRLLMRSARHGMPI